MKRKENRNKFKIGKSVIVTLLMAILAIGLVGCKKPVDASSEPVPSEVVSEIVSEEVSETTTEDVSEVVSEEPSEVEMDLSLYTSNDMKQPLDLIRDMNYNELKIVVWGFFDEETHGAKAILSDGDSYTISEDDSFWLYYPGTIVDVQTEKDYIGFAIDGKDYIINFHENQVDQTENIEVPITTIAADGTEDTITIYVTIE